MRKRKSIITPALRSHVFNRDNWICQHCGVVLEWHSGQLAHLIPATTWCIRKYGIEVVDHPLNLVTTCSLRCNNAVQLTNKPIERDQLADEIGLIVEQQ